MRNKVKFNVKKCLVVSAVAMLLCSNVAFCYADAPNNNSVIETQVYHATVLDDIKPVTTDRLMITLTTDEDCVHLAKYFKAKGVQDTFGVGAELSENEALETLKLISTKSSTSNSMKIFTIKSLENEAMGQVWVSLIDENENYICVDSWIGKPFWGQAIVPEAVCALVNQINDQNVSVSITLSSENIKSERAALKIGEKLGAFIKVSNGDLIPNTSETSKFYLKEKNIYRNVYTPVEGNDSQINLKFYKNDELLLEQNISKDMVAEFFKDRSSVEYIFQTWLGNADIQTTADVYTHISNTRKNDMAKDIQNTFSL